MARVCEVTGKKPMVGNNVSHANNKTKRRFLPNLQYRRFWVESENRWVRLRVSSAALRLIDKNGNSVFAFTKKPPSHLRWRFFVACVPGSGLYAAYNQCCDQLLQLVTYVLRAGCNSPPAVSSPDCKPASAWMAPAMQGQQIWCNSRADGQSPDERAT